MRTPTVTLVAKEAALRPFGLPPPACAVLGERVVQAVRAGSFDVSQPVAQCMVDGLVTDIIMRARMCGINLTVILPSGEMVDSVNAVMRFCQGAAMPAGRAWCH